MGTQESPRLPAAAPGHQPPRTRSPSERRGQALAQAGFARGCVSLPECDPSSSTHPPWVQASAPCCLPLRDLGGHTSELTPQFAQGEPSLEDPTFPTEEEFS